MFILSLSLLPCFRDSEAKMHVWVLVGDERGLTVPWSGSSCGKSAQRGQVTQQPAQGGG